ncbi:cytochrome P450 family protein [Amycolatopsis pigmentata]|uniref:Cytochrome P450 n=1 Tax=Amycolatopsis pigmentata TaxID=450801 RepID=A0ABW5G601_9PSEU
MRSVGASPGTLWVTDCFRSGPGSYDRDRIAGAEASGPAPLTEEEPNLANNADALAMDAHYVQHPHEVEAELRKEAPARLMVTPRGMRMWLITRYSDVKEVLVNPLVCKDEAQRAELLSERHEATSGLRSPEFRLIEAHMLNTDPPGHTRLRKLVAKAFTTRAVVRLRPRIESLTEELLDGMADRDDVDLVADFAAPLPITVICELLGVPENDRDKFGDWARTIVSSVGDQRLADAAGHFRAYLADLVTRKRADPSADMLSDLIAVTDGGDQLSEDELVAMASLLVIAGHDTTVNLIANGTLNLLRAPEQLAALRADPGLVPAAVEELLRYEGPVHLGTARFTTGPISVGGVEIPAGEFLAVSLASANRDPERFEDPDRVDIARQTAGHLAFGHGIHHCLGAPLARLEGTIAIGRLIDRFPRLRLAADPETLTWRFSTLMRGLEKLPVSTR